MKLLAKSGKAKEKKLLINANASFISTMVDSVARILKGEVRLTKRQLSLLEPFEQLLERFIGKKTRIRERRVILQQGGFLGALIRPILSLLGGLLNPRK
jgi:hypothetical protein